MPHLSTKQLPTHAASQVYSMLGQLGAPAEAQRQPQAINALRFLEDRAQHCNEETGLVLLAPLPATQCEIDEQMQAFRVQAEGGKPQMQAKFESDLGEAKREKLAGYCRLAMDKGCSLILTDHPALYALACELAEQREKAVAVSLHPALRLILSEFASQFYRFSEFADFYRFTGITGTNGKTSCVHFCARLSAALGVSALTIGTLGLVGYQPERAGACGKTIHESPVILDDAPLDGLTSPSALQLMRLLAVFHLAQKSKTLSAINVFVECSSHGIHQGRTSALPFAVKALSNLSQDHLDYHESFDAYARVKTGWLLEGDAFCATALPFVQAKKYFNKQALARLHYSAAVPAYEQDTAKNQPEARQVVLFVGEGSQRVLAFNSAAPSNKTEFRKEAAKSFSSPLPAGFNDDNLALAVLILAGLGYEFAEISKAIPSLTPAKGRLQQIASPPSSVHEKSLPKVFVDYAHTPDALERAAHALSSCRKADRAAELIKHNDAGPHSDNGLLWLVFGCGGDRDTSKRALMGAVAQDAADVLVVTSDNPRGEDPARIIEMIEAGFSLEKPLAAHRIVDRLEAINFAIASAANDDTVLIAGKGHEDYQIIGNEKRFFSDALYAERALAERLQAFGKNAPEGIC